LERDTIFIRQADAFLDCIETGRRPLCTLDEGLQTLRVNLALLNAAETDTWQAIES
jgi:predicted dehydrogenase